MDLREKLLALRKSTGMNRRQFAEYFGIPYRTVQDWELGHRTMPEYLLRLMVYKVHVEKLCTQEEVNAEERDGDISDRG